jgi:hypothetical protein
MDITLNKLDIMENVDIYGLSEHILFSPKTQDTCADKIM